MVSIISDFIDILESYTDIFNTIELYSVFFYICVYI